MLHAMSQRRLLIAANWKMHPAPKGWDGKDGCYMTKKDVDVVVFPTFLDLERCIKAGLTVGAQYGMSEPDGAFTGDISMKMLAAIGCTYVLCGHSERRLHHDETDVMVAAQAKAAIDVGVHPIVCVGETLEERESGKEHDVIRKQMKAVSSLPVTFAYEPVWAISGGDPTKPACDPQQAQEIHAFIRSLLPFSRQSEARILYGGSMKPENAAPLLSQPDIDGGLVGGASLDQKAFAAIVAAGR